MASCCCGVNTIVNLPVPPADKSDGDVVDVSDLQGRKTIELSGSYEGSYAILGSHDGNLFFPVANFNSGGGAQTVRKTVDAVASVMKVHREAPRSDLVTVNLAAREAIICVPSHGQTLKPNQFASLATLPPGASGPQAVIDLFQLVPQTGIDVSNIACAGAFVGQIAIECSLDGASFSPVGSFYSSQSQRGSQPGQLMFDPIVVTQIVRFLRVNVLPGTKITGPTSLTIGGPQNCDCVAGGTLGTIADSAPTGVTSVSHIFNSSITAPNPPSPQLIADLFFINMTPIPTGNRMWVMFDALWGSDPDYDPVAGYTTLGIVLKINGNVGDLDPPTDFFAGGALDLSAASGLTKDPGPPFDIHHVVAQPYDSGCDNPGGAVVKLAITMQSRGPGPFTRDGIRSLVVTMFDGQPQYILSLTNVVDYPNFMVGNTYTTPTGSFTVISNTMNTLVVQAVPPWVPVNGETIQ